MGCNHLDDLAEELMEAGIMTNAEQLETGIWNGDIDTSRIFNNDETPQFISYGRNNVRSSVMTGQIRIMTGQKTL